MKEVEQDEELRAQQTKSKHGKSGYPDGLAFEVWESGKVPMGYRQHYLFKSPLLLIPITGLGRNFGESGV